MNKKLNTICFLLRGTLFNVLVTMGSILLLIVAWVKLAMPNVPENVNAIGFIACFIGGAVIAFLIYRAVFKLISSKVDIEKYFDPLFRPRFRKRN